MSKNKNKAYMYQPPKTEVVNPNIDNEVEAVNEAETIETPVVDEQETGINEEAQNDEVAEVVPETKGKEFIKPDIIEQNKGELQYICDIATIQGNISNIKKRLEDSNIHYNVRKDGSIFVGPFASESSCIATRKLLLSKGFKAFINTIR